MQYVVNAEEMKRYDHNTITKIGIPSLVLMERAALETVSEILKNRNDARKVLIVAGIGNNGGDGLAIGRILAQKGMVVTFLLTGDKEKATIETDEQIKILYNLGFSIQSKFQKEEYDIVVDAIFGIGLKRNIESDNEKLIEEINELGAQGAFICSVDIPSGINADTGKIMGCAVRADLTVSYAFAKRGHLLYPGKAYTGKLVVKDIGISDKAFLEKEPSAFCYTHEDVKRLLPQRRADGNKGTFGKVLLVAGSYDMCGACIVCGTSILRTGAGMVKIISQESNREIIQSTLPEAMLYSYSEIPDSAEVHKAMEWADVVVLGPGLGQKTDAYLLVKVCLENSSLPMVIDADALNLISEHDSLKALLKKRDAGRTIFTPHPGELVRLVKKEISVYKEERMEMIEELLGEYGCILVAKDATTVVVSKEGAEMYLNISGNDGMATAGSGDALAGIIAGLLSQKTEGFVAATLGVYLHGLAGEEATSKKGRFGMIASDLVKEIPTVMKR